MAPLLDGTGLDAQTVLNERTSENKWEELLKAAGRARNMHRMANLTK